MTLPLSEARKNDEVISLSDSQMLRWIDELNGIEDADYTAKKIKRSIKMLKKQSNSLQNRREIKKLYEKLDKVQYKRDYMCLVIDKEKDYRRACRGFTINDVKYVRLLGTNGGVKNETIVFVSERLSKELRTPSADMPWHVPAATGASLSQWHCLTARRSLWVARTGWRRSSSRWPRRGRPQKRRPRGAVGLSGDAWRGR